MIKISDMCIFGKNANLTDMFRYYNKIVFDGELREIQVEWATKLPQAAGMFIVMSNDRNPSRNFTKIQLSRQLLAFRSEFDITNVLVHEMIHALLYQRQINEHNAHGPIWMSYAIRVNQYFGFQITQYHYSIDKDKYQQLTNESKRRVQQSFLGNGRVLQNDIIRQIIIQSQNNEITTINIGEDIIDIDELEKQQVKQFFDVVDINDSSSSVISL